MRELNLQARGIVKSAGELGKESRVGVVRELAAADGTISIERGGERYFAEGERVMFPQERSRAWREERIFGNRQRNKPGFHARSARRPRAA